MSESKNPSPPESSVLLAAKNRFARMDTRNWDDQTPEERESLIDSTRDQISSGPLLTKAKYLAKIGATAWGQLYPGGRQVIPEAAVEENKPMTITEFLEARIAEDEASARAATPGPWEWEPETDNWGDCGPNLATVAKLPPYPDGSQSPVETVIGSWGHDANGISVEPADANHIARHDPARVLAECAAKRAIMHVHHPHDHGGEHGSAVFCDECQWDHGDDSPRIDNQPVEGFGTHPCQTLAILAAIYADHPDYQDAWAL